LETFQPNSRSVEPNALELGCGTGALSCLLAAAGFHALGLDISSSAVDFARRVAQERDLKARFQVADLCAWDWPKDEFDLVVDSHLLHCIVFPRERRALLENVCAALRPEGEFWTETMLLEPEWELNPAWKIDEAGVIWAKRPEAEGCADAVQRDGEWWVPQRFVSRSKEFLLDELQTAGLEVVAWEFYAPLETGCPGGFRARCRKIGSS
jgi:SAM-dependent methyltransferase